MSGRKVQVRRDVQGIHLDDGVNVRGLNRDETAALEAFFATDHSMCARLGWVDADGGFWTLEHPVRTHFTGKYTTDEARKLGYLVPVPALTVPALTVEERVVEALQSAEWGLFPTANEIAAGLAELGLLAEDGES